MLGTEPSEWEETLQSQEVIDQSAYVKFRLNSGQTPSMPST